MKKINVAVVGVGGMGKAIISPLKTCQHVNEVVACDVNAKQLDNALRQHNIRVECFSNILCDDQIPLVFITASNDAHKELAIKSMKAGKAVMCEKPIANTIEDAEQMVQYAEDKGVYFQIGFELRYSHLYTKVKGWIEQGLLGDIVNVSCNYICSEFHRKGSWRNKLSTGGSMVGEKLSHYIDLSRWWIGSEVKSVYSLCSPNVVPYYEVHDNYHIVCNYGSGAVSHLTFMMAPAAHFDGDPLKNPLDQQKGDGHQLRYIVVGTKGAVETSVFDRTLKRWEFSMADDGIVSKWVENHTWDGNYDHFYFHNTTDQAKDIVRRVLEGLPPKTPARDSLETMKVCFAAEKSAESGDIIKL